MMKVYMTQGVVGDLGQTLLYSGQYSSCSPVVMFNRSTGMGGYFHFPGSGLVLEDETTEIVKKALREMYECVSPTDVYVFEPPPSPMKSYRVRNDQDDLEALFKEIDPRANVHKRDEHYVALTVTLGEDGDVAFSKYKEDTFADEVDFRSVSKGKRNVPKGANVELFGVEHAGDDWISL